MIEQYGGLIASAIVITLLALVRRRMQSLSIGDLIFLSFVIVFSIELIWLRIMG